MIMFLAEKTFAILLIHTNRRIQVRLYLKWLRARDLWRVSIALKFPVLMKYVCMVSITCVTIDVFRCFASQLVMMGIDAVVELLKTLYEFRKVIEGGRCNIFRVLRPKYNALN
jgi:hypothetical protein